MGLEIVVHGSVPDVLYVGRCHILRLRASTTGSDGLNESILPSNVPARLIVDAPVDACGERVTSSRLYAEVVKGRRRRINSSPVSAGVAEAFLLPVVSNELSSGNDKTVHVALVPLSEGAVSLRVVVDASRPAVRYLSFEALALPEHPIKELDVAHRWPCFEAYCAATEGMPSVAVDGCAMNRETRVAYVEAYVAHLGVKYTDMEQSLVVAAASKELTKSIEARWGEAVAAERRGREGVLWGVAPPESTTHSPPRYRSHPSVSSLSRALEEALRGGDCTEAYRLSVQLSAVSPTSLVNVLSVMHPQRPQPTAKEIANAFDLDVSADAERVAVDSTGLLSAPRVPQTSSLFGGQVNGQLCDAGSVISGRMIGKPNAETALLRDAGTWKGIMGARHPERFVALPHCLLPGEDLVVE